VAAAVVAHRRAQRLGQLLDADDQLLDRQTLVRRVFQRRIEVVDIGLVVLAVWISIVCASMWGSSASKA
jgi:hypothetical protein